MNVRRTGLTCRNAFLVALVWLPVAVWGAASRLLPEDLTMRVWTRQQGLPDDSVTAVLQTRDGYLWVGT